MKKLIVSLLGIALVLAFVPVPGALTQSSIVVQGPSFGEVKFVTDLVKDDDSATALESAAIHIKYIGSEESGTIDINSNVFELFSGPLGTEVINGSSGFDANTGDVCGTTNDSLDVTDAQCDTPAELVNVINDSGAPWVAVLGSVLGAETLATAAEYIDPADAQAKRPGGYAIRIENAGVDTLAVLVRPDIGSGRARNNVDTTDRMDIEFFLLENASSTAFANDPENWTQDLKDNPFSGLQVSVDYVQANLDSATTWELSVYCVRYKRNGRRDDRLVYQTTATTDATDFSATVFNDAPVVCGPGETALIFTLDDTLATGTVAYSARFLPAGR
jgi:hypothetical protein